MRIRQQAVVVGRHALGHLTTMMTDLQKCITSICNFPTLYKNGHKTPVDVMRESGYKELFKEVTIESIATYLRKHQKVIESWVEFSDDIRHSPAWGFGRDKNGNWQVVYADHGDPIESFTFDNEVDACARMIKETIELIRQHEN